MPMINTTKELREAVRHGKYAWPGGYPCFFITDDGGTLSFEAVKQEYKQVLRAVKHEERGCGWRVVAMEANWEDNDLYCDHTNAKIECAYPPDEPKEGPPKVDDEEGEDQESFP